VVDAFDEALDSKSKGYQHSHVNDESKAADGYSGSQLDGQILRWLHTAIRWLVAVAAILLYLESTHPTCC
jgi:hypothetical protein